jgi:nucleoside-diphosphate-sugar epimerase
MFGVDILPPKNHSRIFKADLSHYDQNFDVVRKISPISCIIHLAADSRRTAKWKSVWKNNIIATKNIYTVAKKFGVKRIIFASSNQVTYGYEAFINRLGWQEYKIMINTRYPVWPISHYGVSKVFGEAIARMYYETAGLESICLRIGTVTKDDNPIEYSRLLPTWLSHKDAVQLFKKSIISKVKFGIYYGVSNNKDRFWDISNAIHDLGYEPECDASLLQC